VCESCTPKDLICVGYSYTFEKWVVQRGFDNICYPMTGFIKSFDKRLDTYNFMDSN